MEYTKKEKEALDLFRRTDFKNITKNEIISCVSMFKRLSIANAEEAIAKFPELANLLKNISSDYQDEIKTVIQSDNESLNNFYNIYSKDLDYVNQSGKEYDDNIKIVLESFGTNLNRSDISEEQMEKIRDQMISLLDRQDKKDAEKKEHEKEILEAVNNKDIEKRAFDWKTIIATSVITGMMSAIAFTVLGGNFDHNLTPTY